MARYGQQLLRQLTFQYCDRLGCSVGMREYIQSVLPAFKQKHPDVQVVTVRQRNSYPLVKAEYALPPNNAAHLERSLRRQQEAQQEMQQQQQQNQKQSRQQAQRQQANQEQPRTNSRVIVVNSRSPKQIQQAVWWLTQSQCRPVTSRVPARHIVSKNRSIQGAWTVTTF